ncbi:MAG: DotI/IcmL/TraM family protein [Micavibrio sp.]|nr:DotI/IcmL/TraM family protein [Micavibrio sp.]
MRYGMLCVAFTLVLAAASLGLPALARAQAPAPAPAGTAAPATTVPAAPAAGNAPAATPMAAEPTPDWMNYQNPYAGEQNDLSNPNRTPDEVLLWAGQQAATVMTYTPETFNDSIAAAKKVFSTQGWNEFGAYAHSVDLVSRVRDRQYSVTTIVKGNAAIVDSGPVAGSYHWLVRMPLMVTFLHDDADGNQQAVDGGDTDLTMQVGRVQDGTGGPDSMVIEGWRVASRAPDPGQ